MWCSTPYTEAPGEDGQLAEKIGASNKSHIRAVVRQIAALTFDKRECLEKVKDMGGSGRKVISLLTKGDAYGCRCHRKKGRSALFCQAESFGKQLWDRKSIRKKGLRRVRYTRP